MRKISLKCRGIKKKKKIHPVINQKSLRRKFTVFFLLNLGSFSTFFKIKFELKKIYKRMKKTLNFLN